MAFGAEPLLAYDSHRQQHSSEEFMKALDERDNLRDKAYDRFGREKWTDEKVLKG